MNQNFEVQSPIINSPFREPQRHWQIEKAKPPVKAEDGRRAVQRNNRISDFFGRSLVLDHDRSLNRRQRLNP